MSQPAGIYGESPAKGYSEADVVFAETGVQARFNCFSFQATGPWQVDSSGKLLLKGRLQDGSNVAPGGCRENSDQATRSGQLTSEQFTFSISYPERADPIGPYTVIKGGKRLTGAC